MTLVTTESSGRRGDVGGTTSLGKLSVSAPAGSTLGLHARIQNLVRGDPSGWDYIFSQLRHKRRTGNMCADPCSVQKFTLTEMEAAIFHLSLCIC